MLRTKITGKLHTKSPGVLYISIDILKLKKSELLVLGKIRDPSQVANI